MKRFFIYSLILGALASCAGSGTESSVNSDKASGAALVAETVADLNANTKVETKVLVSKGVIRSDREVRVFASIEGQLKDVKLIEGQRVRRGELLFSLEDSEVADRVALCKSELEQAKLRMQEILIGQGYKRDSLEKAPEKIKEYARIKSGVNVKEKALELNLATLRKCRIVAPQDGLVTLIEALPYDFVEPGQTLCYITDPNHLIVQFSILETELSKFKVGTEIELRAIAYANIPHKATVRSINSTVDAGGMVKVEAVVADNENLMPGMTAVINL